MPKQLPNYNEPNLESLRPFSKIKLVALDLDGTLLDSRDSILPEKVRSLASALSHYRYKVKVTIATGRTLNGARSLLDKLHIPDNTPIILYNGSIVTNNKYDILHQAVIPSVTLQKIVNLSSKFKVKLIAYVCNLFGVDGPNERAIGWSSLDRPSLDHNNMIVKWMHWGDDISSLTPSTIVIHTAGHTEAIPYITSGLNEINTITYTRGGDAYIEVRPINSNKGTALEFVAKELKLDRSQVLAMGDNDNDAEMLTWAGIGVAVDSASEMARQSSNYIANQGVIAGAIEVLTLVRSARKLFFPMTSSTGKTKQIISSIRESGKNKGEINNDHLSSNNLSIFVPEENVHDYCYEVLGSAIDDSILKRIISIGLLSVYKYKNQRMILKSDLSSLISVLAVQIENDKIGLRCEQLISRDVINIKPDTRIDLVHEDPITIPAFYSAVRNIISAQSLSFNREHETEISVPYFPCSRITSFSDNVIEYAKKQLEREKIVDISTISQFARSAHYMGSKRALCAFLAEGISSVLPQHGILIDLMCGSGVASGAFSRIWKTYSSDAQEFCRILAVIHGGGFDRDSAQNVISRISPIFKLHFNDLNQNLLGFLNREEKIFCSNTSELLIKEYKDFINTFPTLINLNHDCIHWIPEKEVTLRKEDQFRYPYCLFTTYFANVYFGVRQSVEIDSLRYSIDQLKDDNEKCWALGALIATVSALGTTYGGHFAQPKIRLQENINLNNISNIIDKRSPSIIHEFTVRLLNLSEQSQKAHRRIESVPGPWSNALKLLDDELNNIPVLVYLDAPYTREEYSRYYHVLETLVKYNYPSCTGTGLTPKPNERFKSEFFTKTENQIAEALINVITNILQRDWMCAWSYSDSAKANIYNIINSVHQKTKCHVKSYSTPFVHKSQGRRKHKIVTEYLIIFSPIKSAIE